MTLDVRVHAPDTLRSCGGSATGHAGTL